MSERENFLNGEQVYTLQHFFEIGVIRFGEFKLKHHENNPSAPPSPFYIDFRLLRSYPASVRFVASLYEHMIAPLKYDFLADIPNAITPITTLISQDLDKGFRSVRLDKKSHGTLEDIDGFLPGDLGKTAVLIDDLATKGTSKFEAIERLRDRGINISDVVVLIDREQGARQDLSKVGIKLHSAFGLTQILDYYLRTDSIDLQRYKLVKDYISTS